MVKKNVFLQAMDNGPAYSFWFFAYFMMTTLPIVMLFFYSLFSNNLPGVALAMVFGAILVRQMKLKRLFALCRDMAILNLTLWFLLGFFTFVQSLSSSSAFVTYLLLTPYALLSGYLTYFLLSRANHDSKEVLHAGVMISTMIAVVSAINGAILSAMMLMREHIASLQVEVGSVINFFSVQTHNPHLAFLLVLVMFNVAFVRNYFRKSKFKKHLLFYLIPLGMYFFLQLIWQVFVSLVL